MEKRDLPWRQSKDPYRVWLSEIILQQTRVDQGLPYFHRFIENYPNVKALANASEKDVLKLWEGLGYYSRGRNLLAAAKIVSKDYNGRFPETISELTQLPGVGMYTSAAIASICFNVPEPVIDGNVFRLISRHFRINEDISIPKTRKTFEGVLKNLIPNDNPGDFNQAMMELGATICKPKSPDCEKCPVNPTCDVRKTGEQLSFPIKTKKQKPHKKWFHYFIFEFNGHVGMKLRRAGDIWQGLYDFHLVEFDDHDENQQTKSIRETSKDTGLNLWNSRGPIIHVLTHRRISAYFHRIRVKDKKTFEEVLNKYRLISVSRQEIVNLPRPKLIVNYLDENEVIE